MPDAALRTLTAKRGFLARYGVAVACVVLGWAAREALSPVLGQTALPFTLFFPAVTLAAWYGGLVPGLVSILLSAIVSEWFFVDPVHSWAVRTPADVIGLGTFIASALVVVAALEVMHRARGRALLEVRARELAEVRQTTTLSSIGDAVLVTDENGNIVSLNREAERLTGWRNNEAQGQPLSNVFRIINEKTRQPAENPVETVLRAGTVVGMANHTLLIAKDGREIQIDDSAAPIREPDGPMFGVVLVFRDASAQRQAQQSSERLAAIVEHSGDAMITKDLNGIVQTWNAAAEQLFGYSAEEIVGRPITTLFPPDRLKEEDHILALLRGGKPVERFETIRVAKDGRQIPVAVSISPLRDEDGQVIGASKVLHDISDLVEARDALVRERELLATTLSSIGDAVIVTDADGKITFMNPEAQRLTRWTSEDAAGQPLPAVFRIINEHTRAKVEDPVEKVLRLGEIVGLANHTILIAKDDSELPIDDSAAPIREPGGPLFGVVLVFRDFTERKQMEDSLRASQEQLSAHATELARTVAERTAKLEETVDELRRVSYAISHDMRAPLRAMNTFANLLLSDLAEGIDVSRGEDYCQRIITATNRLDKLIQDALDYMKVAQHGLPVGPVNLSKLVSDLIRIYPNLHPEKADIVVEDELPTVIGNETLLSQCFSNLLGNAVKFVAPGVGPKVRVRAEYRDSIARIWVEDNGIGIPKNPRDRLFKMFQKLDTEYEGTGIGLAIVHKVVERMGGKVGVESEPGEGSRFWVELPVAKREDEVLS
jgi:PAS domain S-box-containing protein